MKTKWIIIERPNKQLIFCLHNYRKIKPKIKLDKWEMLTRLSIVLPYTQLIVSVCK